MRIPACVADAFASELRRAVLPRGIAAGVRALLLHYQEGELNGNSEGSMSLRHQQPGGVQYATGAFDAGNNRVESNAVTGFSPWVIAQNTPAPAARLYLALSLR